MLIRLLKTSILATMLVACGALDKADEDAKVSASPAPATQPTPAPDPLATPLPDIDPDLDGTGGSTARREPCTLPRGAPARPVKIAAMMTLINALPKPVTMPCILDVLARPLDVNATTSTLSVQPAAGEANPRIFVLLDTLVLAFVPDGEGSHVLEMSEFLSATTSVKGEIELPVATTLDATAPFDRIMRTDGVAGTSCSGCHANESLASGTAFGGKGFESKALRQSNFSSLSLAGLLSLANACADTVTPRCDVFNALVGKTPDGLRAKPFQSAVPTLF